MTDAVRRLAEQTHPGFPVSIYYAFKQSETKGATGTTSIDWETFLDSVIRAGFSVTGTWPMRTEQEYPTVRLGANALASSIVLVCRQRPATAPIATRGEFVAALRAELPTALAHLQSSNIAQAAIGPGIAVFTRYAKVLNAEGKPVSVREALALINQILSETFISIMVDRIARAFQPARVVLFGSHARGTATEWSDIDLLVILPKVSDKRNAAIEIRRALGDLPVCKDIVVATPAEVARRGHLVGTTLRSALREGKVLYERHERP